MTPPKIRELNDKEAVVALLANAIENSLEDILLNAMTTNEATHIPFFKNLQSHRNKPIIPALKQAIHDFIHVFYETVVWEDIEGRYEILKQGFQNSIEALINEAPTFDALQENPGLENDYARSLLTNHPYLGKDLPNEDMQLFAPESLTKQEQIDNYETILNRDDFALAGIPLGYNFHKNGTQIHYDKSEELPLYVVLRLFMNYDRMFLSGQMKSIADDNEIKANFKYKNDFYSLYLAKGNNRPVKTCFENDTDITDPVIATFKNISQKNPKLFPPSLVPCLQIIRVGIFDSIKDPFFKATSSSIIASMSVNSPIYNALNNLMGALVLNYEKLGLTERDLQINLSMFSVYDGIASFQETLNYFFSSPTSSLSAKLLNTYVYTAPDYMDFAKEMGEKYLRFIGNAICMNINTRIALANASQEANYFDPQIFINLLLNLYANESDILDKTFLRDASNILVNKLIHCAYGENIDNLTLASQVSSILRHYNNIFVPTQIESVSFHNVNQTFLEYLAIEIFVCASSNDQYTASIITNIKSGNIVLFTILKDNTLYANFRNEIYSQILECFFKNDFSVESLTIILSLICTALIVHELNQNIQQTRESISNFYKKVSIQLQNNFAMQNSSTIDPLNYSTILEKICSIITIDLNAFNVLSDYKMNYQLNVNQLQSNKNISKDEPGQILEFLKNLREDCIAQLKNINFENIIKELIQEDMANNERTMIVNYVMTIINANSTVAGCYVAIFDTLQNINKSIFSNIGAFNISKTILLLLKVSAQIIENAQNQLPHEMVVEHEALSQRLLNQIYCSLDANKNKIITRLNRESPEEDPLRCFDKFIDKFVNAFHAKAKQSSFLDMLEGFLNKMTDLTQQKNGTDDCRSALNAFALIAKYLIEDNNMFELRPLEQYNGLTTTEEQDHPEATHENIS